jgi:hypothetical protein
MIGSLLTKSREETKHAVDLQKFEKLCVTIGEEITFVKNYIAQVMNDQNTLITTMNDETRRINNAENLVWTNSNIFQFDCGKSLNLLVDNVPQCFDELKKLTVTHNTNVRKKRKTLKDQLTY